MAEQVFKDLNICEVLGCGEPVTHQVNDMVLFYGLYTYPVDSEVIKHYFCDLHTREPRNGTREELGL
jgi:hypothetical protein